MNVGSLISTLKNQGIQIQFVDGNLKISDHGDKITPVLLAEIKEKKAEIIAFFKKYSRKQDNFAAIAAAEKQEYYPLSSAQRRLYIVQWMADDSISYHIPYVLELPGTIDKERMAAAFRGLIIRHESFRTGFRQVGEEPVQIICDPGEIEFKIEYYSSERDSRQRFFRPFDLSRAPLMRVGLVEGAEAVPRFLMIDMHHIISDGTSIGLFIQEFMTLYAAQDLPHLRIQYKEYSQWQSSDLQKK
ncbi:MAG: condensation domain-containing protein, partial [Candidatus Aminicenantes bacterium]|nr:condensation domain-containing protein [Candidatus Aminicenantes bacterium]